MAPFTEHAHCSGGQQEPPGLTVCEPARSTRNTSELPSTTSWPVTDSTFSAASSSMTVPMPCAVEPFVLACSVKTSSPSWMRSSRPGTFTWNEVAPAGTVTEVPAIAVKVLPPSKLACSPVVA